MTAYINDDEKHQFVVGAFFCTFVLITSEFDSDFENNDGAMPG